MKERGKVFIFSMGCHRRFLDAQKISEYLKANDFKLVKKPLSADYIILNTCAYKKRQEDFAIKKIKELKLENKKLIVGGCLPKINEERMKSIFSGPTFGPDSLHKIDDIFNPETKINELPDANRMFVRTVIQDITHAKDLFRVKLLTFLIKRFREKLFKRYYYIRISWGCLGKCSYCGIKKAIGPFKSKPLEECLAEFRKGISMGFKFFTIIADDLGAYGTDIGKNLPELIKKFMEVDGDYKIHLFEIHPKWVIKFLDELIPLVKTGKITELLCPIQSGSDTILKAMNRFHNAEEIKNALLALKEANPQLRIVTHIIVGFPGESEDDFKKTIKILKDINCDYSCLFPYSDKPDTVAASIPGKTPQGEIKRRIKEAKKSGV